MELSVIAIIFGLLGYFFGRYSIPHSRRDPPAQKEEIFALPDEPPPLIKPKRKIWNAEENAIQKDREREKQ